MMTRRVSIAVINSLSDKNRFKTHRTIYLNNHIDTDCTSSNRVVFATVPDP